MKNNSKKIIVLEQTHVRGITCSASARNGKVMGSMLGHGTLVILPDARCSVSMLCLNCIIAKDVKSCTCCCYVRCTDINSAYRENRRTHYHTQLGLLNKEELVVVRMAIELKSQPIKPFDSYYIYNSAVGTLRLFILKTTISL